MPPRQQQQHSFIDNMKFKGEKLLNEIRPLQVDPNRNVDEENVGLELTGELDKCKLEALFTVFFYTNKNQILFFF